MEKKGEKDLEPENFLTGVFYFGGKLNTLGH